MTQLRSDDGGLAVALVDPGDFTPAYDRALLDGLNEAGVRARLFGHAGFTDAQRPSAHIGHFYRLAARWGDRRWLKGLEHAFDLLRLAPRLKTEDFDLVHLQWLPLPILDRLFCMFVRRRRPLVLTVHDSNPYNGGGAFLMRAGFAASLRTADAVIVHTGQARERVAAMGVAPDRLHVVPHGLLHQRDTPEVVAGRRSPEGPLRLLSFGKIKPYKGIDLLLEALARLDPEARAALRVDIVGEPYMPVAPFEELVRRHGLGDCVAFDFSFVDEARMAALFAAADALLMPYREIDASGVAMTAMAHGLPVLATRVGGLAETFADNEGAVLVPPEDPAALAAVLARWAAEPDRVSTMRRAMRAHVEAVPSWNEIARRTLAVYEKAGLRRRGVNLDGARAKQVP
ncbi:MAG: glycosyltransferase family 4 protein [Geminicoccaceae bacterium]|nr:glycosyltransferase family 4 protein [Geminicoccaceae bacterium]